VAHLNEPFGGRPAFPQRVFNHLFAGEVRKGHPAVLVHHLIKLHLGELSGNTLIFAILVIRQLRALDLALQLPRVSHNGKRVRACWTVCSREPIGNPLSVLGAKLGASGGCCLGTTP
jgi:hypothetical protein